MGVLAVVCNAWTDGRPGGEILNPVWPGEACGMWHGAREPAETQLMKRGILTLHFA